MGAVYVLVNLSKGRFYVGSARDWRVRLREHRAMLGRGKHPNRFLQNDWSKTSPDGWRFIVLEDEIPEDFLLAHEQVYLSKVFDNQDRCYNIMPLARKNSLGVKRGQETKDRISRANSGKKRTQECRERLKKERQILKGKKVWKFSRDGVLLGFFPGLREAENLTKVKRPSITDHLKGEICHAGGFLWTLDPEGKDIPEKVEKYRETHPGKDVVVVGYDPVTGEVKDPGKVFSYLEISWSQVQKLCDLEETRHRTYKGLVYRRLGEPFDLKKFQDQEVARTAKMGFRGKHTEETKRQISRSKSMVVEGLDSDTGEWTFRFKSVREAARKSGTSYGTVLRHCNNRLISLAKKWRWGSI